MRNSKIDDIRVKMHKQQFEVCFDEGIPDRKAENRYKLIYPEELLDKKCVGCVRCKKRDHNYNGKSDGWHCSMLPYDRDISPDDKACVNYWDKVEEDELNRLHEEDVENRRKELWAVYVEREPVKLPIIIDEFGGNIPQCPVCGEMPHSTEQCYFCGQRFIQDETIKAYNKKDEWYEDCHCGGKGTLHIIRSKYNGHKRGSCSACGMRFIE